MLRDFTFTAQASREDRGDLLGGHGGSSGLQEGRRSPGGGMEIEVAAALLLAGIFAFFILVYTVFLQCWWKCRQRWKPVQGGTAGAAECGGGAAGAAKGSGAADSPSGQCSCFRQTSWEPIDLAKYLQQQAAASGSSGPGGAALNS